MDEFYKSLSVRLYGVMEHVGASEEMRQLHQATAIQNEITWTAVNYMQDRNLPVYIFGSFMEGSTSPGLHSDMDVLHCNDMYPVHENIADARAGQSYLMVNDAHTRPGYIKLQEIRDGVQQTVYNYHINDWDNSDCNNKIGMKYNISSNADKRTGPAHTTLSNRNCPPSDRVAAYRCSWIPRFADDWSKLKRKYNWPSRFMIDSMTTSGCFVVGVGHPTSDEKHIEWRLSFSLQERNMVLSFNPTQHKCYILLKMVKNDMIGRTIGKCVSSYHMKTCMFYIIQTTKPETWIPTNLFLCLNLCLNVLLKWVRCGYCPNFFIKEENMFDRHVHRQVKQPLSYLLERIIQAGPRLLMCIDCDNINKYMVHPKRLTACVAANKAVKRHRHFLEVNYAFYDAFFRRSLLSCCKKKLDGRSTCLFLNKQLQFVKNASIINRKPNIYCCQTLSQLETYIESQIGSSCMSLAFDVAAPDIKHSLLNMAETHFQKGRYCDMTSSRLMYASDLYMTGHYDRCVRLLEKNDVDIRYHVVSSCSCHIVYYRAYPTQRQASFVNTASCIVFLPSNRNVTPAPLLPEMYRSVDTPPGSRDEEEDFWFDCAAVDGKIYLLFLKYLAYTKLDQHVLKQVAIDNMKWVIGHDPNLGHRETALNLLGWIHSKDGRIREGVRCFVESWKIRPEHNAAKWHVRSLVWRLANAGIDN